MMLKVGKNVMNIVVIRTYLSLYPGSAEKKPGFYEKKYRIYRLDESNYTPFYAAYSQKYLIAAAAMGRYKKRRRQ